MDVHNSITPEMRRFHVFEWDFMKSYAQIMHFVESNNIFLEYVRFFPNNGHYGFLFFNQEVIPKLLWP